MKLVSYLVSFGLALTFNTVLAVSSCNCADGDTTCQRKCVEDTNNCIDACKGDITCYNECIYGWPGVTRESTSVDQTTTINPGVTTSSSDLTTTIAVSSDMVSSSAITDAASSLTDTASSQVASTTDINLSATATLNSGQPTYSVATAASSAMVTNSLVSSISDQLSSVVSVASNQVSSAVSATSSQVVSYSSSIMPSNTLLPSSSTIVNQQQSEAATGTPAPSSASKMDLPVLSLLLVATLLSTAVFTI